MTFQIVSTRNGVSPVTGSYRDDLAQGDLVGLALSSMVGVTQVRWEIKGRPEGSAAGGAGPEPVLLANAPTASFTVDSDSGDFRLDGAYTIQATINPGSPGEMRITAVLARVSGLTIPGPGVSVRTLRKLGGFEALEDVSVPAVLQGWATEMNRWLELLRETVSGGAGGFTTLAGAYAHGASSSDQTMVLHDALGGGVVIDAAQGDFTGASALRINTAAGGPLVVDRATGRVGIGIAAPLQAIHAKGSSPALRLDRTGGAALDVQNVGDELQFLNGATILGKFEPSGGLRADLGVGIGTAPATNPVLSLGDGAGVAVSAAGTARFRYNSGSGHAEFSENAGPWQIIAAATIAYDTWQNNGVTLTQRAAQNAVPPLVATDNAGATRTDISLAANGISNSLLRQSAALSVIGNPTNATANVQDIVASTPSTFLGMNAGGTALAFGTVPSGSITGTANTVPFFNGAGVLTEATSALGYDPTNVRFGSRVSIGLPLFQVHLIDEAAAADRGVTVDTYQTGTAGPLITLRVAQGTYAAPTAVDATKYGGQFLFQLHDGTSFVPTARLFSHVSTGATVTTGNILTDLVLQGGNGAALADPYSGVGTRVAFFSRNNQNAYNVNPLVTLPSFTHVFGGQALFGFGATSTSTYNSANFGTSGFQVSNPSQVLFLANNSVDTSMLRMWRFARSRGTNAAPAAVVGADSIGGMAAYGYDGSNYTIGNTTRSFVDFDGTVSAGSVPTDWGVFIGDGTGLPPLFVGYRFDVVAGDWSQLTTSSVSGFPRLASTPGVPTGIPITIRISANPGATTTATPVTFDTSHQRLYAWLSGHWAPVAQDTTGFATGYLKNTATTGVWSAVATIPAADVSGLFYQTVANGGSSLTQRPTLNFVAPLSAADNSGASRTDVSLTTDATLVVSAGALGRAAISGDGSVAAGSNTFALSNIPTGTTAAGTINFAGIAAPASPASGRGLLYFDSTSLNIAIKNASGVVNHGVRTDPGASHKWVSAINDDGTVTLTQPTAVDITGLFYQTVQAAGSSLTQRPILNFTARFSPVDNSGATRTDVDLSASGVTAGTYSLATVTVDVYGRVTAASAGSSGTVTNVTASLPLTSSGGATPNIALNYDNATITLNGSNQIQVAAFTGDVTRAAGATVTALANIPNDVTMAGDLLATAIAAPALPAAGKVRIYVDLTSLNIAAKTAAGVVNHGVRTAAPVGHQWVNAIADDGTVSLSQPAYSDISGTPTLFYQTIQAATSPLTQRAAWNAAFGLTAADNAGAGRTDLTVNLTTGIPGGQAVVGGTNPADTLTLSSTANASKGAIAIGSGSTVGVFNELTGNTAFGQVTADGRLHVATTDDTTPGTAPSVWDSRFSVFGASGSTGTALGVSTSSAGGSVNLNAATPGTGYAKLRFNGSSLVFYAGGATLGFQVDGSGNVYDPVLTTNGLLKTTGGTGQHAIALAGTDYLVQAYTTVAQAGSNLTQRSRINFIGPISAVDNSGATRTDVSLLFDNASLNIDLGTGKLQRAALLGDVSAAAGSNSVNVVAVHETSGPTQLTITAIPDAAPDVTVLTRPAGTTHITGLSLAALMAGRVPFASYKFSMNAASSGGVLANQATVIVPGDSGSIPTGSGMFGAAGGTAITTTLGTNYGTVGGVTAYRVNRAATSYAFQVTQISATVGASNGANMTYALYTSSTPVTSAWTQVASWSTGAMNTGTVADLNSGVISGSCSIAAGDVVAVVAWRNDNTSASVLSLVMLSATLDLFG